MAKRGRLEVIQNILLLIQDNRNLIRPTPLIRKSGLSTSRFKHYYADLLAHGFVVEKKDSAGKTCVSLTSKGSLYLEKYQTIVHFIDEFEL